MIDKTMMVSQCISINYIDANYWCIKLEKQILCKPALFQFQFYLTSLVVFINEIATLKEFW
jgi:hypothetical protein